MPEYRAIYKCRMCGEEFENGRTKGESIANSCVIAISVLGDTIKCKSPVNLHEHYVHNCKDGSFGFSDFIGMRKVE